MKKRKDGRYEQSVVIDGRRKVFYGSTQREVKDKVRNYEEEKEAGPLFSSVAEEWKDSHEKKVSHGTMKPYKVALSRAKDRFKGKRITEITPRDINNFILYIAQKDLSQKTVTNHLSVVNMIFRKALIDGHIDTNPAELIKIPTGLKKTPRELPPDQELKAVRESLSEPFGLLAFFAMYTGMRKGELLALTYQDIDRANKIISVNKAVYWISNAPYLKDPKTAAGRRTIPLLDELELVLPDQQIGYVFPGKDNALMTQSYFQDEWDRYRKATGITCGLHQLRHAMATFCYEAGLSTKDAQDILGHADITTTQNIYTHIRNKRRTANAKRLNEYLSSEIRQDNEKGGNRAN